MNICLLPALRAERRVERRATRAGWAVPWRVASGLAGRGVPASAPGRLRGLRQRLTCLANPADDRQLGPQHLVILRLTVGSEPVPTVESVGTRVISGNPEECPGIADCGIEQGLPHARALRAREGVDAVELAGTRLPGRIASGCRGPRDCHAIELGDPGIHRGSAENLTPPLDAIRGHERIKARRVDKVPIALLPSPHVDLGNSLRITDDGGPHLDDAGHASGLAALVRFLADIVGFGVEVRGVAVFIILIDNDPRLHVGVFVARVLRSLLERVDGGVAGRRLDEK